MVETEGFTLAHEALSPKNRDEVDDGNDEGKVGVVSHELLPPRVVHALEAEWMEGARIVIRPKDGW